MIRLTVNAADPTQLADLWEHLHGSTSTVDIVDGDMVITVDIADAAFEQLVQPELQPDPIVWHEPNDWNPDPPATVAAPRFVTHTPPEPTPSDISALVTGDVRHQVLEQLADRKQTVARLAEVVHADAVTVKACLHQLREEGLVRLAGVAGWALTDEPVAPITRTSVDADAARRRAAEAM
jgi:hypothetical protein